MNKPWLALGVLMAASIVAVSPFVAPSVSRADTIITNISVSDGTTTYTGGAAGNTWTFAPITLAAGQSLVLTQNQAGAAPSNLQNGLPGFNFDSSEGNRGQAANQYTVTVTDTLNGAKAYLDTSTNATSGALNDSGADQPASTTNNEAANWVRIGGVAGQYDLYVGYADTLHSNACKDGGNCLPFVSGATDFSGIWDGTGGSTQATTFLGSGTSIPGYPTSGHCNVTATSNFNCFDAGALLIVSTVPEPSTVLLVGTLIVGLTGWGVVRNRKRMAAA